MRIIRILPIIGCLVFTLSFSSFGQNGVLDPGFGIGGRSTVAFDSAAYGAAVIIQPDGKIVSVAHVTGFGGRLGLTRHNTDGSPDNSFGVNGVLLDNLSSFQPRSIALQPDGKILVAGEYRDPLVGYPQFGILRYTTSGTRDASFGNNGLIAPPMNNYASYSNINGEATRVVVTPVGKILVGGHVSGSQSSGLLFYGWALAQFNMNGTPDLGFANNGVLVKPENHIVSKNFDMLVEPNGKIISVYGNLYHFIIGLTNADGSTINGSGASVNLGALHQFQPFLKLAIQDDGKLLVAGNARDNSGKFGFGIVRCSQTGIKDNSFGTNGGVITHIESNNVYQQDAATGVHVLPNGKILATGTRGSGAGFVIVKYKSNGTLDSSFGKKGIVTSQFIPPPNNNYSKSEASVIQPDGKIVLTGMSNGFLHTLARYEQNGLLRYNNISGNVFYDANSNGVKDATEKNYSVAIVRSVKANIDSVNTIPFSGQFSIDVDTGSYKTKVQPYSAYHVVSPASITTSHTNYFNHDTTLFAVQPIPGKHDVGLAIFSPSLARPGFDLSYRIIYLNKGTDTATGQVFYIRDQKLTNLSYSPAPAAFSGDTVKWNYSNLKPLDTASIIISCKLSVSAALGDSVINKAIIISNKPDLLPADNSSRMKQIIQGAYDPNDKREIHGPTITRVAVEAGEYLQYMIRFQNTGTDTAFNIYITDTLSTKFDWNSFQMIEASHAYSVTIRNGRYITWAFNNIYLVDSNKNEALSHGYVVFRIKAKTTVGAGEVISNNASIYFDYNLPVVTNTHTTTVIEPVLPVRLLLFTAKRNGTVHTLQWKANETGVEKYEILRSADGKEFTVIGLMKAGLGDYSFDDKDPLKGPNFYRLKMIDKDGSYEYSPIRILDKGADILFSLQPNPAKDDLLLTIRSEKKDVVKYEVVTPDGRVIYMNQLAVTEGESKHKITIAGLPAGAYFMRITSTDHSQQSLRFIRQ